MTQAEMLAKQEAGMMSEQAGFFGTVTGGASDLLSLWGQYEATKLNNRFLELNSQNASLEAVQKNQNAQAQATPAGVSMGDWIKANPALAGGIGLGLGLLLYLAVK